MFHNFHLLREVAEKIPIFASSSRWSNPIVFVFVLANCWGESNPQCLANRQKKSAEIPMCNPGGSLPSCGASLLQADMVMNWGSIRMFNLPEYMYIYIYIHTYNQDCIGIYWGWQLRMKLWTFLAKRKIIIYRNYGAPERFIGIWLGKMWRAMGDFPASYVGLP